MYRSSGNGVRGSIPSIEGIVSNAERPQSPDVAMGAYLVTHLQQRCENCLTCETPQWRKGWFSTLLQRWVVLCNACGLKFNKNQFCPYCMYVYYKEEERKYQQNNWATCRTCQRWVHLVCENQYGDGTFHFGPSHNTVGSPSSPSAIALRCYQCPTCRGQDTSQAVARAMNRNNSNAAEDENDSHTEERQAMDYEGTSPINHSHSVLSHTLEIAQSMNNLSSTSDMMFS